MKLVDIETKVTALLYDNEHEEEVEREMTVGEFLDEFTAEALLEIPLYFSNQFDEAYLQKRRWIPATERLPNIGQRILAVGMHGKAMYTAVYNGGMKGTEYRKANPYKIISGEHGWRSFTYWMPLPEPPKEES